VPALELRSISKIFAGKIAALSDVNLEVAEGAIVAVVGPSGSGKSTLLRIIAGLETPSAGELRLNGIRSNGLAPRERDIAMVFQNNATYPHLTVAENLAFGLKARRVSPVEIRSRVQEMAALLGLTDFLKRKPETLSGGERQRVALGRALVRRPKLLLLDEPFSSLDAPLRVALRAELRQLHRQFHTTTLHVTHDQEEALALGDVVVVLDRGKIAQVGTPEEVYDRPATTAVAAFLGDPPMNLVPVRPAAAEEILVGELAVPVAAPNGVLPVMDWADRGQVCFGFRAERARLIAGEASDGAKSTSIHLPARAIACEHTGREQRVRCDVGGTVVTVLTTREQIIETGKAIQVVVDAEAFRLFDHATRRAITVC
jgi:ABC-type sugar transport system ATPase subunit